MRILVPPELRNEANSQLVQGWRRFSRALPGCDARDLPGLSLAWGNVPYFAWNAVIQSGPVISRDDLADRLERAAAYMNRQGFPGILMLCEDWVPKHLPLEQILEPFQFTQAWKMTGMVAERLLRPVRPMPELEFRRVAEKKTLLDLYDINSLGYGIDLEPGRASTGPAEDWSEDVFGFVAYKGGEPVASAATFPIDGRLYIGMVATVPAAQRRGYAEAVLRHSLHEAARATGLTRTVLHTSDAGLPLYERMGYQATARFAVYRREIATVNDVASYPRGTEEYR
jgi:ribosomal protein S18 acetylase RimI-like enzyme